MRRGTARLAGPAAAQADLDDAFAHVDGSLLAVTLAGVLLILALVYRSVLMPLLVTAAALLALATAGALLYASARAGWLVVDGRGQGIVFVIVMGASTDYAPLLAARYQEELARRADTAEAVAAACRATVAPVLAGAATVASAMTALTLSALPSHQALGPAVAVAMACCAAASLTFLPAALLLCGHRVFWPRPARFAVSGIWDRLSRLVELRPCRLWPACLAVLIAGAASTPLLSQGGVPLHQALPAGSASTAGQETLARRFPAGTASPLLIVTPSVQEAAVLAATATTPGVAHAVTAPALRAAGQAQVLATLTHAPDSEEARDVVERLRGRLDGTDALVGGQTAVPHDLHPGLILAATFASLTVMPLLYLAQIGFIVAAGVLIDALLVRLFLVPALILDLGQRTWWPAILPRDAATSRRLPQPGREIADDAVSRVATVRKP
ncbi:MMPL family transporter [Streptomyces sp. Qhu_M48]|uniref:MMPL family transporter n=1 Tax=Streptomyces sp. Qhu_M48 TaxID=3435889 RepID=UPI003F504D40